MLWNIYHNDEILLIEPGKVFYMYKRYIILDYMFNIVQQLFEKFSLYITVFPITLFP